MKPLNKKQIICLVLGLFFALAVIAIGIWAGTSGVLMDKNAVPPTEKVTSFDQRRFVIGGRATSSGQQENVRIIASISTKRPISFLPATAASKERSSKIARSDHRSVQEPSDHEPTYDLSPTSVLPRPPSADALVTANKTEEDGHDYLNVSKLLGTAGKIFGIDLSREDPSIVGNKYDDVDVSTYVHRERGNWVTLSYLSLSVFLLKQMDRLLQDSQQTGRHVTDGQVVSNSLNLLFVDPAGQSINNATELELLVTSDADVGPSDFSRLVLNMIKASQMNGGDGLDCIWSAYCVELNYRAERDGIAGSIARLNSVLMELMAGQLTPPSALAKMIRSVVNKDNTDCRQLFPTCEPAEALDFLLQLVTSH